MTVVGTTEKPPDFASATVPDALAKLQVKPEIGLTSAEGDTAARFMVTMKRP